MKLLGLLRIVSNHDYRRKRLLLFKWAKKRILVSEVSITICYEVSNIFCNIPLNSP